MARGFFDIRYAFIRMNDYRISKNPLSNQEEILQGSDPCKMILMSSDALKHSKPDKNAYQSAPPVTYQGEGNADDGQ